MGEDHWIRRRDRHSERLGLPHPSDHARTSIPRSLPVHGRRSCAPQAPRTQYIAPFGTGAKKVSIGLTRSSLLVRWGPPQGVRTLPVNSPTGRDVAEGVGARAIAERNNNKKNNTQCRVLSGGDGGRMRGGRVKAATLRMQRWRCEAAAALCRDGAGLIRIRVY